MTLLVVGEAMTAFMRSVDSADSAAPFDQPVPSGAPMIFASVAARLGAAVVPVGAVGNDLFGRDLVATLEAQGADVSHMAVRPELPTTIGFVTYLNDGGRRFSFYLDGTAAPSVSISDLADTPERADWLHVSGSALTMGDALADAVVDAVRRVRAAGGRISVDPNVRPETASEGKLALVRWVVELADVVLPSQGELEALGLSVEQLLHAGSVVVITHGAGEVDVYDRTEVTHVQPPDVREVNADGAGDAFAAGLVTGLRRGVDLVSAVELGCRVAAASIQSDAPMSGAIDDADVWRER